MAEHVSSQTARRRLHIAPSVSGSGGPRQSGEAVGVLTGIGALLAVLQLFQLRSAVRKRILPFVDDHAGAERTVDYRAMSRHRRWPQNHPHGIGAALAGKYWRAVLHHTTAPAWMVLQDCADIMFAKADLNQKTRTYLDLINIGVLFLRSGRNIFR